MRAEVLSEWKWLRKDERVRDVLLMMRILEIYEDEVEGDGVVGLL